MGVIVVATDGSSEAGYALAEAIALARVTGDTLAAITVWSALQGSYGLAYPASAGLSDLLDAERTHAEQTLEEVKRRARAAGVELETTLATGDPARRICEFAADRDARLIAIGTHGYGTVASLLVGSVSSEVIRKSPCPVLVVRARTTRSACATVTELDSRRRHETTLTS